jgi:PilZ domain
MIGLHSRPADVRTARPVSRAARRSDLNIPVLIEVAGEQLRGWASHISEHGIGLTCCGALHADDSIAVTLTLPTHKRTLTVRALVSRSNAFTHTCVFIGATSEQRRALREEALAVISAAS